ncbi:hypothetical protein K2173_026455 [Erythroxylum novogranatense]|uniref:Nucleoside diphosphate kinase n=1 Tax=Erythroxylum novogranatense TaxID=1862640 RepID=A0AAV8TYR5_9ROSI|nr:hypothetical protein K2173_026455 [Erythroxylum novogranatense]
MEAVGVFNGARPHLSTSSILRATTHRPSNHLTGAFSASSSSSKKLFNLRSSHLAAFHSHCPQFSYSLSGPLNAKTSRRSTKTHIFLPHLVASMEQVEQTYIMVKPDGVQRGLVGEIISRFEKKGFRLTGLKLFQCPKDLAEAWEGVGVVASARKLIGSTDPLQAEPGTIRGDLAVQTGRNVVHGSDSPENGKREIALWFKEGEVCQWTPALADWIRE